MEYSRYGLYVQAMAQRNAMMLFAGLCVYCVLITLAVLNRVPAKWYGLSQERLLHALHISGVIVWYLSLAAMAYYYFGSLAAR